MSAVACIALTVCEKPPADSPRSPPERPLALSTSAIDTMTTLARWMSSHPGDIVSGSAPDGALPGRVCRTAIAYLKLEGRSFTRSAVFHVPSAPPGETFPSDTTRLAERLCRLRAMWLSTVERDSLRAIAAADSIVRVVDSTLGPGRPRLAMRGKGTGEWQHVRSWAGPGTTVVLGIVPPELRSTPVPRSDAAAPPPTPLVDTLPRRVIVASFAAGSGLDTLADEALLAEMGQVGEAERELELARADSAIEWSGATEIAADLRTVLAHVRRVGEGVTLRDARSDSALVRAVAAARGSAPRLDPARRSATLLAADLVLAISAGVLDADSTKSDVRLRRALQAAGAPYENSPLGEVDDYTRALLWDAYRADSLGRAGRASFVELLSLGMATKINCGDGSDAFDRVIDAGEKALRAGATDPLVHYYVAAAHADIVALSNRSGDDFSDPLTYRPRAPHARARAVQHYREALNGLTDRRLRRAAWTSATSLMLETPMSDTRFFCVYD